ncbi:MAG TPA: carbamoyltransferase C-terminal domain-containing protein [Terriglobales bacterium]|jgi:carbamoyltransferase|nr:carbamoyltransferase C-terminal domain-containing protein [Terriglobales bacterium]
MRILGLSSFKHDTAAALLEDGMIKSAIENDKLARSRTRGLPRAAIRSCLEGTGAGWEAIDMVAVATRPFQGWARKSFLRTKLATVAPVASAYYEVTEISVLARELNDLRVLRRETGGGRNKIVSFNHQLCHAASAFFSSPFEQSLIVVMDEDGDGNSALLAVGQGTRIRVVRTIAFPHSLAWLYSQITDLIGFRPQQDEHKTQWLSLEGEPQFKDLFLEMLSAGGRRYPRLDYSFFNRGLAGKIAFSAKFYRSTGLSQDPSRIEEEQRRVLASSVQAACTEVITRLVEDLRRRENLQDVCFAGGLFQNMLLVASLERTLGMNQVFVPVAPGNAGTSLGAAYLGWHRTLRKPRAKAVSTSYWGPKFSSQQTKDVLDNSKSRYALQTTVEKKLDAAVQLLLAGKIVGWFQGSAEFGPRALGNRSVLASPWAPYVKENLNDFIKHREWFRPFAVSVPEEDSARYFDASRQCQSMNSLARVRPGSECLPEGFLLPGNQVRLHVVERCSNPLFWGLLKRFGEVASAPMLLNTSFNLFGEPLVVTPRDAIRSYFCSGIDALVIENFVLTKSPIARGLAVNVRPNASVVPGA